MLAISLKSDSKGPGKRVSVRRSKYNSWPAPAGWDFPEVVSVSFRV